MKVLKILLSILFVVIATSCSKGEVEDDFNTNSGNLSGWWIYEEKLEGDGAPTIAWAYWFHGEVVEGEYMLSDHKESGFSRNAFGKWYMNANICVDQPYHVEGTKVFIYDRHSFNIVDGNLIDISSGRVYTRQ